MLDNAGQFIRRLAKAWRQYGKPDFQTANELIPEKNSTAELTSQVPHEMDAPVVETALRNVVAEYAEQCVLRCAGIGAIWRGGMPV